MKTREHQGKPELVTYQLQCGAIVKKLMIPVLDEFGAVVRYTDGLPR